MSKTTGQKRKKYKYWCLYHTDEHGKPYEENQARSTYYHKVERIKQQVRKNQAHIVCVQILEWDGTAYNPIEVWSHQNGWQLF